MKKWIIALTVLLVVGAVVAPLGYAFAKVFRSRQHMEAAITLKDSGEDRNAYLKMQSAYNLNPAFPPILEKIGPYAADVGHPNTLQWWTEAARAGVLDLNETLDMIEYGLDNNQVDRVRPFLAQFVARYPDSESVRALQLRILRIDREDFAAYTLARDLVENGNTDSRVISTYVYYAFSLPQIGQEGREEALDNLKSFSTQEDETGLLALRTLIRFWETLEPEERDQLSELLADHPEANLSDRLILLSRIKRDGANREDIRSRAETVYEAFPDAEDRLQNYVNWLNLEGYQQEVLDQLEGEPGLKTEESLFFARQQAWILSGQPEKAYNASLEENPLSAPRNLILRAQALARMDRPEEAEEAIDLSIEVVELGDIGWLESALTSLNFRPKTVALYESILPELENPAPANVRLMQLYYEMGMEDKLSRIIRQIPMRVFDVFPGDKIDYLYYNLLFGQNQDQVRAATEEFASRFPNIVDFRVLLAFSYALSGSNAFALQLIEPLSTEQFQNRRKLQIMLATIYARNGRMDEAQAALSGLSAEELLGQERTLLGPLI